MFDVFTVGRFTREASRLEVGVIFTDQLEEVTSAARKDERLMLIGTPPWPRPTRQLRVG
jgi:hypothetical protein